MNQSDIFAESKAQNNVPLGYIPVTMCSLDKLSKEVLHFRNYSLAELLEISMATETKKFELIVKALNNMVFEDVDCANLHIENIKQIILTIYLNFWNKTLFSKAFYKDLNGDLEDEKNIDYVDIDLTKLNFKQISKNFKNPFTLIDTISNKKIKVVLPTVGHIFEANSFLEKEFREEEEKYFETKLKLESIKKILESGASESDIMIKVSESEKREYEEFKTKKEVYYYKLLQCQLLHSVDNKELSMLEKIELGSQLDPDFWTQYSEAVTNNGSFGLNDEYKFVYNGKEITRRFYFRPLEFIPTLDQKANTRYVVSFDD